MENVLQKHLIEDAKEDATDIDTQPTDRTGTPRHGDVLHTCLIDGLNCRFIYNANGVADYISCEITKASSNYKNIAILSSQLKAYTLCNSLPLPTLRRVQERLIVLTEQHVAPRPLKLTFDSHAREIYKAIEKEIEEKKAEAYKKQMNADEVSRTFYKSQGAVAAYTEALQVMFKHFKQVLDREGNYNG